MRPISRVRASGVSSSIVAMVRPFTACFSNEIMMIGEAGDLRQVRHADHLAAARELLEPPAHGFRRAAAHARVDFVEHQRHGRGRTPDAIPCKS